MSRKSARIQDLLREIPPGRFPLHYRGYFACFNRGWYYEAHDVLEEIWLQDRHGALGHFYKGLIQLAGAFVHLQKERLRPSAALFRLARANFQKYPVPLLEGLEPARLIDLCDQWESALEAEGFAVNPLPKREPPRLEPGE